MTHTDYHVLARKWRPRQFDQVIGQPHVVTALTNALTQQKLHHAYLLTGTRGVGKTTLARLLAKCLNCETGITAQPCDQCTACVAINQGRFMDLYEIDAASRTKVEDTRALLDNVPYAPTQGRFKIYLIDEVHMLSNHSFNALLKTLEEPPDHVKFILATTDPQKIPATILSRCLRFSLRPIDVPTLQTQLSHILTTEAIPYDPAALTPIAEAAQGSLRDALSVLDQCIAYGHGEVTTTAVIELLGLVDEQHSIALLTALSQDDGAALIQQGRRMMEAGLSLTAALASLMTCLRDIALIQVLRKAPDDLADKTTLIALAQQFSPEQAQLFYQILCQGQQDFPYAPNDRCAFEMTLLRLLAFTPNTVATNTDALINTCSETLASDRMPPPLRQSAISSPQPTPVLSITPRPNSLTSQSSHLAMNQIDQTRLQTQTVSNPQATTQQEASNTTPAPTPGSKNTSQPSLANLNNDTWTHWLRQLNLSGATLALAQQCCVKSVDHETLILALSAKFKPLHQPQYVKNIKESLISFFRVKINVIIEIDDNHRYHKTPAEKRQQTLLADPQLQALVDAFDATLHK